MGLLGENRSLRIKLFDQLTYLAVYGNKSELDERVGPSERDAFFAGLVESAGRLRAKYAGAWKAQRHTHWQKSGEKLSRPKCSPGRRFSCSDDADEASGEEAGGEASVRVSLVMQDIASAGEESPNNSVTVWKRMFQCRKRRGRQIRSGTEGR